MVDVLRKFVAHRGADFRGSLIEQIISGCKAADIGYCLNASNENVLACHVPCVLSGNRKNSLYSIECYLVRRPFFF